ncbi:hypothetical protein D3C85_776780 [compost metagenome]
MYSNDRFTGLNPLLAQLGQEYFPLRVLDNELSHTEEQTKHSSFTFECVLSFEPDELALYLNLLTSPTELILSLYSSSE